MSRRASENLQQKGRVARELLRLDGDSFFIERTNTSENILALMEAGRFEDAVEVGKGWQVRAAYRRQVIEMVNVGKKLEENEVKEKDGEANE